MLKSLRYMVLIPLVVCFARGVEAQAPGMSADDTVNYINTTLHKYPTLEYVRSGCPGFEQTVSISDDRRSLVIQQTLMRTDATGCVTVETVTVPVFHLNLTGLGAWSKQGQHTVFFMECINRVGCFSYRMDMHAAGSPENQWYLRATAPDVVSKRLEKAIQHLADALLAESVVRAGPSDTFSSSTN